MAMPTPSNKKAAPKANITTAPISAVPVQTNNPNKIEKATNGTIRIAKAAAAPRDAHPNPSNALTRKEVPTPASAIPTPSIKKAAPIAKITAIADEPLLVALFCVLATFF